MPRATFSIILLQHTKVSILRLQRSLIYWRLIFHSKIWQLKQFCLEEHMRRRKRLWSVHSAWKLRKTHGYFKVFEQIIPHERKFFEYFRMSISKFELLFNKIRPLIEKQCTAKFKFILQKDFIILNSIQNINTAQTNTRRQYQPYRWRQ